MPKQKSHSPKKLTQLESDSTAIRKKLRALQEQIILDLQQYGEIAAQLARTQPKMLAKVLAALRDEKKVRKLAKPLKSNLPQPSLQAIFREIANAIEITSSAAVPKVAFLGPAAQLQPPCHARTVWTWR